MQQLEKQPDDVELMQLLNKLLTALQATTLKPDFWHAQNIAFRVKQQNFAQQPTNSEWREQFSALYDNLNMKA